MSLIDALLLETHRDPKAIWFAKRADGQRGVGTENDPWDGGIRIDHNIALASLDQDEDNDTQAVATTAAAHGFVEGEMVIVEGVTGGGAEFYNGTFVIHSVQSTSFKYDMQGDPEGAAEGTSIAASRVVHQLDEVLRDLANENIESIHVRIGPGTFETRGSAQVVVEQDISRSVGWRPRTGWKISGSGIDVTVLKVVGTARADKVNNAIGAQDYQDRADYAEVCDLTVDCNMEENPGKAVGAVQLIGSHTRIRRVRAINFGTEAPLVECFVLVVGGAHPVLHATSEIQDCVIEDCVAELPWPNNVRETTILHIAFGERPSDGVMAYPKACAIRNCYVNCDYPGGKTSLRIAVESLVPLGDRQYELTTKTPHQRTVENNIVLNNVVVGIGTDNIFNGSFKIDGIGPSTKLTFTLPANPPTGNLDPTDSFIGVQFHALTGGGVSFVAEGNRIYNCPQGGPYQDTWSSLDCVVRNNVYSNVENGPFGNMGRVSTTDVAIEIESIIKVQVQIDPPLWIAHVDTSPIHHGFSEDDFVQIVNISPTAPSGPTDPNRFYYGRFEVLNPSATTFDYALEEEPELDELSLPDHAPRYFTSDEDQPQNPAGPQWLLEQTGDPPVAISYALESGRHVATAQTTYEKHGLSPGDAVLISKASRTLYNGFFTILQVPDAKTFKYELPGNPGGTSTSGYFGRLWQIGRLVIEDNVIELAQSRTYFGGPRGILLHDGAHVAPYVYRQLVVRRNIIRLAKRKLESTKKGVSKGIDVLSCEDVVVENNVIDLDDPDPISLRFTGPVRLFNNKTPSGKLIEGLNPDTGQKFRDRVHDLVSDALVMAF